MKSVFQLQCLMIDLCVSYKDLCSSDRLQIVLWKSGMSQLWTDKEWLVITLQGIRISHIFLGVMKEFSLCQKLALHQSFLEIQTTMMLFLQSKGSGFSDQHLMTIDEVKTSWKFGKQGVEPNFPSFNVLRFEYKARLPFRKPPYHVWRTCALLFALWHIM